MSPIRNKVLLGVILQQAGLVSAVRLKQAIERQKVGNKDKIGEILASMRDISQQTADFFAEGWFKLVEEKTKQPIGQYLKQAGLLTDRQIQTILEEQKQTELKFGELAIAKGWLKRATVNFFLHHLETESSIKKIEAMQANKHSGVLTSEQLEYSQKIHEGFVQIKRKLLKLEDRYSEATLDRVLWWTGGQSVLTQKLFELLSQKADITHREIEQIDYIVHTMFLNDWENNELGKHLQAIRDRLDNSQCQPQRLLELYQKILSETVPIDTSKEQQELINIGLVVRQQERAVVANRIYRLIFNHSWVSKQLKSGDREDNRTIVIESKKIPKIVSNSSDKNISDRRQFDRTIQKTNNYSKLKNALLLLTFVGLLSLLFDNIAQRIEVRAAFQKGNRSLKQKLYDRAIVEYDRILDRDSNYHKAWTYRGYALSGLEKYQEMVESCSTATIIEPNAAYAWNCRGEALFHLEKNIEAIDAFDRAIAINKTEPIFLINKSRSLRALGKNEESITTIRSAIEILEQIEAVEDERDISNEFAIALTFMGNSYIQKEQQAAIDSYNRALTYVPDYFPAQIGKGVALNMAKRYDRARDEFNNILNNAALTPTQQAQTLFYLGQTLCSLQQNLSGIAQIEKAIALQPDYETARALEQCTLNPI